MLIENCFRSLGSLLKPYAAMGRKDNVSLTDLNTDTMLPFHSGVSRFLIVFILPFVVTGTPTPLSFPKIANLVISFHVSSP